MAYKLANGRWRAKVTFRGEVIFRGKPEGYSSKPNAVRAQDNFKTKYERETGIKIARGRQPGDSWLKETNPTARTLSEVQAQIEVLYIEARAMHVDEITEIDRKLAEIRA